MKRKFKIGFINFSPLVYDVETPYKEPLGGTESAMCYLTVELAKLGHEVVLFGKYSKSFSLKGVLHEDQNNIGKDKWQDLDFMIIQSHPKAGMVVKPLLNKKTKLILWEHLDIDQPPVSAFHDQKIRNLFDWVVFVSNWQMERFIKTFGIDRKKSIVIRNAVSPAFENLKPIKSRDPVLAYTATPFRGLDILIHVFPEIKKRVPKVKLKIFSSFKVYQQKKEETEWEGLYQICRSTEGIEYVGSVGQERLAKELKEVSILTYPNTFPETSCITALEAMAAGCQVVSSQLGAIPETTAGFAKLIPFTPDNKELYCQRFIETIVEVLKTPSADLPDKQSRQLTFINNCYTWEKRAEEWKIWFEFLYKIT